MILYYFPIAQNTDISRIHIGRSDIFFRDVYACICICTYFAIFLFAGLISVYVTTTEGESGIEVIKLFHAQLNRARNINSS